MQDAYRAADREVGLVTRDTLFATTFPRTLVAASAIALSLCAMPHALAQVFDPLRGYALDGTPVGPQQRAPRGRDVPVREEQAERQPRRAFVSPNRLRAIAAKEGFRLAGTPHRRGQSIVALAENDGGHRFELVFNGMNGALVQQRDLGAVAVAKGPEPAAPTSEKEAQPAPVEAAAPQAAATPATDDGLAAARADAAKAAAAEASARQALQDSAAENRRAQARLAQVETAARHAAEVQAQEARRAQANAAEEKRKEARAAETKRRALADAESKLNQAKALREKAEADMKKAEAEAANARAAIAPAEMAKTPASPAEMAPVAKATQGEPAKAVSPDPAGTAVPKPDMAKGEDGKPAAEASHPEASVPAAAPVAHVEPDSGRTDNAGVPPSAPAHDSASTESAPPAAPKAAEATDPAPTGSMKPADGTPSDQGSASEEKH